MKTGKCDNIQKRFMIKFLQLVIIPIIVLIGFGVFVFIQQSQAEQKQNLTIMLDNLQHTLEQEIETGALKFGQFLLLNNNQVLEQLSNYSEEFEKQDFHYFKKLEENFNYLISPDSNIDGAHFYFNNGDYYSHKTYVQVPYNIIREKKWYKKAKQNPNIITVALENRDSYIPNTGKKNQKELLFIISPDNYDANQTIDIGIMFQECTALKTLENLEDTGYIAYLIDSDDKIIFASDEKYIDDKRNLIINEKSEKILLEHREIARTDMKLALVKDQTLLLMEYYSSLFVMLVFVGVIFIIFFVFESEFFKLIVTPISHLSNEMRRINLDTFRVEVNQNAPYEIQNIQEGFNHMTGRISRLVMENQKKERERHEEELNALQLQINPHFLSNTLNTIKFMAQVSKHEGIRKMSEYLMQIMDCTFRNHDSIHTLKEEVAILEAYIYIVKIRYAESFEIQIDLDERCEMFKVPKLILQPFVENAVFHGMEEEKEDGVIRITIQQNSVVEISVQDNGQGITEEMQEKIRNGYETKPGRIGISNVVKRMRLYYGEQLGFAIKSEAGQGTNITIQIPIGEQQHVFSNDSR